MHKNLVICIAVLFLSLFTFRASALTKGFEASLFHPATDGSPYFTMYSTEALAQWQWVIGTAGNFAHRPLQFTQNDVRVKGIVDNTIVQDVYASVGLVGRWLEFGLDVPVGWWINYLDPYIATSTGQNKMAMGDVYLNFKSELVKVSDYRIGFAILPFITIPSGSGKYFNGAGGVTGGGQALVEFLPLDQLRIAINIGVLARQKFTLQNLEATHQALYGFGTAVKVSKYISIAAELWGRTKLTDLFVNKVESPLEVDGGLKFAVGDSGVTVDVGGGAGVVRGSGSPSYRVLLGVNYKSPIHK